VHADLIEVLKITHGYSSVTLQTFFEIDSASITRGHKWKLKKKRINNDLRHHFFSDRIIHSWNRLDDEVVCATSANAFKNRLQRMWERDEFVFGPYSIELRRSNQPVPGGPHPVSIPVSSMQYGQACTIVLLSDEYGQQPDPSDPRHFSTKTFWHECRTVPETSDRLLDNLQICHLVNCQHVNLSSS